MVLRLLTARLPAERRRPMAAALVVLLGLLLTGGGYAVMAPATAQTSATDPSSVARGRQLFAVGCAACHGQNGQGVLTKKSTQYGPPLVGVGAAAVDFQVGTGRMPLARPGAQAPRKEVVYTPAEIKALAAYVASLGPGPAIPTRSQYSTKGLDAAAVARGGLFWRTNCTACHNYRASGGALSYGKYAPTLRGVSEKKIYEALITGPQQMPVFSDRVLKPAQKRKVIAYVKTITSSPDYGGYALGSLGPVTEGLAGWLVGMGLVVGFAVWIASHSVRSRRQASHDRP